MELAPPPSGTAGALVRGELRPGGSGREWCDAEVVRRLRRASLAALRREIEPADPRALGRFLPDWQRVDRPGAARGVDGLRDALAPLQGLALPAAQWEGEVLPRRLADYGPARLDELAARGEIVWVGAGAGGVGGGRVAIYFREDAAPARPAARRPGAPRARRRRAPGGAGRRGELLGRPAGGRGGAPRGGVHRALGDGLGRGGHQRPLAAPARAAPAAAAAAPSAPRGRRLGARRAAPSAVAGRWSLAERLFRGAVDPQERRRATAELLAERHGVLTRSAALAEGVPGGYAAVYPALGELETLGTLRRGYFVEGLGGAQFALPGAVERLRDLRDAPVDGAPRKSFWCSPRPIRPSPTAPRRRGPRLAAALALAGLRRPGGAGGRRARPLPRARRQGPADVRRGSSPALGRAVRALAEWIVADRRRRPAIERVDGEPVFGTPLRGPCSWRPASGPICAGWCSGPDRRAQILAICKYAPVFLHRPCRAPASGSRHTRRPPTIPTATGGCSRSPASGCCWWRPTRGR